MSTAKPATTQKTAEVSSNVRLFILITNGSSANSIAAPTPAIQPAVRQPSRHSSAAVGPANTTLIVRTA